MILKRLKILKNIFWGINTNPRSQQPSFWSTSILTTIIGALSFSFLYAALGRIDEVVTAKGELQPLGSGKPIKTIAPGVIKLLIVKEGDQVERNQLLIKFDDQIINGKLKSLEIKLLGLNDNFLFENSILSKFDKLKTSGAISEFEYLEQKNLVNNLINQIKIAKSDIEEINIQKKNSQLYSPVRGKVFEINSLSEGYSASAGEIMMTIIPDSKLEGKVFIKNSDIGFLNKEMTTKIRIDAYPFTKFGTIDGKLRLIGKHSLPPNQEYPFSRFPAYISLKNNYIEKDNNKYFLKSGQTLSVNFIVRDKPIISLFTNAFEKAWDNLRFIKS